MIPDDTRRKIENIVEGDVIEGQPDNCAAIRNFLCRRFTTSRTVKTDFEGKSIIKEEQAFLIEAYCDENSLKTVSESTVGNIIKRHKLFFHNF